MSSAPNLYLQALHLGHTHGVDRYEILAELDVIMSNFFSQFDTLIINQASIESFR